MTPPLQTADAPVCPPWCTEKHTLGLGGWEDDSGQAGYFYKRCRRWFDLPDGIRWVGVQIAVERWVALSPDGFPNIAGVRDLQAPVVFIGDNTEMTPDVADALADQLKEAARLARL